MLKVPKRNNKPYTAQRRSPDQEKQLSVKLGGKTTKASGSGSEKGDVRVKGLMRVEAKCTKNKSFRITQEMIEKIEDAATFSGELPAIVVEFIDDNEKVLKEVAVVPMYALMEIVNTSK